MYRLPLLATGCLNGFLHIWDHKSGTLRCSCKHEVSLVCSADRSDIF